ncbi:MAG: ABC transporter ATP-binding protein [Burkholderiaceae bacterium]
MAIRLENLTKFYPTPAGRRYVFRSVDYTFPEQGNIGILGFNGAGKSTLMRLIGGTDFANSGRVHADCRISWPVGLAAGFQGSLTGRENVKFVSRVYGDTPEARAERISYVMDFAELGDYFDMPVNTYSSGMRSRLSFGLSMAFEFDVYLVDEVIAVGDRQFKKKSEAAFRQRQEKARLITVSHDLGLLKSLCNVGIVLNKGQLQSYSSIEDAINAYQQL